MTHGREKSDSAIVAGKPTNKVERSTAEPVEPRAEAEGNAGQQSTCRAQDRESVSQALERIRQAARQRKKEKFTALFHHLTIDLLADAFDELKEHAAAGVDGLTWKEYDADLEDNIEDLHRQLHRGAYRALPSRPASKKLEIISLVEQSHLPVCCSLSEAISPLSSKARRRSSKTRIFSSRSRSQRIKWSNRFLFSAAIETPYCCLAGTFSAPATHSHSSCVPLKRASGGSLDRSVTRQSSPPTPGSATKILIFENSSLMTPKPLQANRARCCAVFLRMLRLWKE